ncbi:MAG: hypothetical protein K2K57_02475 [Oscillospiraceae bacterium]|nr:hypothetical protein [Oscillospiraceae bacterium]
MKRQKLILSVILSALIASSCAEEAGNDTVGEIPLSEVTSSEALSESENEETSEASETTETAETSPTAKTTEADGENVTDETEAAAGEKLSELSVAEVGIIGHIEEFDDIVPCKFSLGEAVEPDPAVLETAVNAYRQTDYYNDALEFMKEYYGYDENGKLVELAEQEDMHFIARYAKGMLMESAAPEVDIDAVPVYSYKVGDGHLIVLLAVLPDSLFSWSGTGIAHIPVYVNGSGEAFVLDEACSQDYADCCTVEYEDGSIHAVMDYGHNMGGMRSAVYSFEGGVPKPEIIGWDHFLIEKDMPVLFRYNGAYMHEIYFWNSEASEYCMVGGAVPDEELARAICSDETVLTELPEAWELYQNDKLKIFGGKYVTFYKSNGCTYSLDPQTGGLAEDKTVILFSDDSELPEGIKYYNIDLT